MPRSKRAALPGFAHHVLQRGHNREPVFLGEEDFAFYLENLRELKQRFSCRVYAYCLMLNHVHLLLDAGSHPKNIGLLMKHLAGRHAGFMNRRYDRSGALWEGRFRASPVSGDFLLPLERYIELNPVRSCLTPAPDAYRWSSCAQKLGRTDTWIDPSNAFLSLSRTEAVRALQYQNYLYGAVPPDEWARIRSAIHANRLTADVTRLECEVEEALHEAHGPRPRGRPRKSTTPVNRNTPHAAPDREIDPA